MEESCTQELVSKLVFQGAERVGYQKLDAAVMKRLLSLCDLFDELGEEFGTENFEVAVTPEGKHGAIRFNTDEFVFEDAKSHYFFDLIKNADFLSFSKGKNGTLQVSFGVKDLWVTK